MQRLHVPPDRLTSLTRLLAAKLRLRAHVCVGVWEGGAAVRAACVLRVTM
jgi:hypothetical protein